MAAGKGRGGNWQRKQIAKNPASNVAVTAFQADFSLLSGKETGTATQAWNCEDSDGPANGKGAFSWPKAELQICGRK